jgi:hypothetical protein
MNGDIALMEMVGQATRIRLEERGYTQYDSMVIKLMKSRFDKLIHLYFK